MGTKAAGRGSSSSSSSRGWVAAAALGAECTMVAWASDAKSRTNWSQFPVALGHLTEAFPDLKHFELTIPAHSYGDVIAGVATAAMLPSYRPTLYHEGLAMRLQTKLVQVAMVASITNAVERCKSLELLALDAVPDVWASGRAIAAAATAPAAAATVVAASLEGGWVPSLAAAAATFGTMDDTGCWLLQQHPSLRTLQLTTAHTGWSMLWQQQGQKIGDMKGTASRSPGPSAHVLAADHHLADHS